MEDLLSLLAGIKSRLDLLLKEINLAKCNLTKLDVAKRRLLSGPSWLMISESLGLFGYYLIEVDRNYLDCNKKSKNIKLRSMPPLPSPLLHKPLAITLGQNSTLQFLAGS